MDDHQKEGISVKDIENFTKKHRFEVFFCLAFILSFFFALIMYGAWWSVLATAAGAVLGILLPSKVGDFSKSMFHFFHKQESTTQLVLGIVLLIVAIFLAPLLFLFIGAHGGKELHQRTSEGSGSR